jgi:lipid-binding SYLF domain-containing protein
MFRKTISTVAMLAVALVIGCETAPKTEEKREALADKAQATLKDMYATDPGLEGFIDDAHAYVVFPDAGKGGLIVGGAYGRGAVFQGGNLIGYADMKQGSVGLQAGGQSFSQVIAFQDEAALNRFKNNQLTFAANLSAVILKSGAAASAKYTDGVAVFVKPQGGAMAEASVGGQQFTYTPADR